MIFVNDDQQNKYHQVWKEILEIINGGNGELKLHEKIRLFDNDLPVKRVFKIPSITIVIKSLIEKNRIAINSLHPIGLVERIVFVEFGSRFSR